MDAATLDRLADLVVGFGANVQHDQIVSVSCEPGKEPLVRAIAASAYRRGARFVDVAWFDPWVKRARIELAREETLEFVPDWYGSRVLALGDQRAARDRVDGAVGAGPARGPRPGARRQGPAPSGQGVGQGRQRPHDQLVGDPGVVAGLGLAVFPDLPLEEAQAALDERLLHVLRLDEDDPIAAWRARADALVSVAGRLSERRFDALHYEAPGTDLTIGLLPGASWQAARFVTVDGIEHMPNLPTEEVFTSPDPDRVDGHVTSSKPLVLADGTVVRGLRVRFEGGRAVQIDADTAQDTMRTIAQHDDGAARLGEVALVDAQGRIGKLDTVFYDTLIDENAASHIALGQGFPFLVDEPARERVNESQIHIDFMIGSPEMTVTGITADGDRVPVLVQGSWQI